MEKKNFQKKQLNFIIVAAILIMALLGSAYYYLQSNTPKMKIRSAIEAFAPQLQRVSLLAPQETIIQSIKDNYSPFVSKELLEGWISNPERAPGISNPYTQPKEIKVLLIDRAEDGSYEVQGQIIEMPKENVIATPIIYPVALKFREQNGRWIMTGFVKAVEQN